MAYDIHITRADDWYERVNNPITLEELKEYFSGKNDFKYSQIFSSSGPFSMSIDGDFFIWTNDGLEVPFQYIQGRIVVSRADDEVILKMKEIASDINAKVQGDEGELY